MPTVSAAAPLTPSKDSTEIIHQLQTKILKQQRQLDRLRRQLSTSGNAADLSDVDSASDFGDECDDTDLVLDATLTSEHLEDFSLHENGENSVKHFSNSKTHLISEVPNTFVPNDSADKRT